MRRPSVRLIASILLALLLAGFARPGRALAHAALVRSDPADNAILAEPPAEIRLWYNEIISAEFSSMQLLDVSGRTVPLENIRRHPADPMLMILTPPALEPGVYSVSWRVLSEADGHFTQGLLVFGVGEGADVGAVAAGEVETRVPLAEVLLRWLNFGLLAALVGAFAVRHWVLAPAERNPDVGPQIARAQRRVLGWTWVAGLGAFLVGFGLLAFQTVSLMESLPEGVSFFSVAGQLIGRTRWGALWAVRQAVYLVLTGLFFLARRVDLPADQLPAAAGMGLLLLAATVAQALTGHAAAITPGTAVVVAVDALHLLAVGVWVGGLLALVIGLLPLARNSEEEGRVAVLRAGWSGFGRLSAPSVAVLAATGLYSTGQQIATPDALLTTLYGRALLAKVAVVVGVAAVGLLNAMLLHPRAATPLARLLRRPVGWTPLALRHLPRLVLVEAALGLLVFLGVGVLTASPPARGPEFTVVAEELPGSVSQTVDDMLVTFSAKPNKPGQNVFSIRAISQRRPPPAEILRLIVRFAYLGQEMGTVSADAELVEPDLYRLGGSYLSLPGPWQIQVIVRRSGLEDSVAVFNWTVAAAGETPAVIISRRPWHAPLSWLSGLLLLGGLIVLAGANLSGRRPGPR